MVRVACARGNKRVIAVASLCAVSTIEQKGTTQAGEEKMDKPRILTEAGNFLFLSSLR